MNKKIILCALILAIILVSGCVRQEKAKVACGGWDTSGEVTCACDGKYEKPPCPPNTQCDSGTYNCYGSCGTCKCFSGPESSNNEIPCNGKDNIFR